MAAIVVKKLDDVTNITMDAVAPSPGDGGTANWRQDTGAVAGVPQGHRATLSVKTVSNGPKTARRLIAEYKRPYPTLNTVTNKYEVTDTVVIKMEVLAPQGMPSAEIGEGVYQGMNCMGSLLLRQSAAAGYAPT